jgi:DNA-binding FrmR family transcriptional regulator
MDDMTRGDVLKRLAYIEGHLAGVRRMIEQDTYCVDVLKQMYAVRRAIEKAETRMLHGHVHHCVVAGIQRGDEGFMDELV